MATVSESRRPKEHKCNFCGRTFESLEALNSHQRMEHSSNSTPPAGVG